MSTLLRRHPLRAAVGPDVTVMLDSGVRRGSDVVTARCLGADACIFGRPTLYGVAAGGQAGAELALRIVRKEVDQMLAQIGCRRFDELHAGYLWPPHPAAPPAAAHPLPPTTTPTTTPETTT
jgi:L-lactate dehydrogenase (cytochrome)/(S)-mandelate dehydrogenase